MNPYKGIPNCDRCKVNAGVYAMIPSGESLCPQCAEVGYLEKENARLVAECSKMREALEVAAIDSMTIISWAESHYPGLISVPEWQSLKEQHKHCVKVARAALADVKENK